MKGLNYAMILFFVVGINEIYSLSLTSNEQHESTLDESVESLINNRPIDSADARNEHNDFYAKEVLVNEKGARVKRNRPLDSRRASKKNKVAGVVTRPEDERNRRYQAFLQHFQATIARYRQEGDTLAAAMRRYETNFADLINQVDAV